MEQHDKKPRVKVDLEQIADDTAAVLFAELFKQIKAARSEIGEVELDQETGKCFWLVASKGTRAQLEAVVRSAGLTPILEH